MNQKRPRDTERDHIEVQQKSNTADFSLARSLFGPKIGVHFTYMWSRAPLDAFLSGKRGGIVTPGHPGALPVRFGGTHGNQMDQEMGHLDRTDAGQARRLSQKGGGIPGPRASHGSANGKMKEIRLNLGGLDALGAYNRLQDEMEKVRDGLKPAASPRKVRFTEYAASLFEHKLKTGRIKSAKSRQKWEYMIRLHLAPVFGHLAGRRSRGDEGKWYRSGIDPRQMQKRPDEGHPNWPTPLSFSCGR